MVKLPPIGTPRSREYNSREMIKLFEDLKRLRAKLESYLNDLEGGNITITGVSSGGGGGGGGIVAHTHTESEITDLNHSLQYVYIKATSQSEGDLHLSDATNWATSLANIMSIRVETVSTDWDMYLLQNDNGYVTDDANIPARQIMGAGSGNLDITLGWPYEDEDATSEVHLYYLDNAGSDTADIYIVGEAMR